MDSPTIMHSSTYLLFLSLFIFVRSSWPDSLLIIGWFFQAQSSGYPVTRLCPLLVSVLIFPVHWWCWSPPLSPLRDSPRAPCLQPIFPRVYLSLLLFPPLRPFVFIRCPPVWLNRWRPVSVPAFWRCWLASPTCAASGTWLCCGWSSVGDGAPRDCLMFLYASTGVVWRVGFSRSPDQEGMSEYSGMC